MFTYYRKIDITDSAEVIAPIALMELKFNLDVLKKQYSHLDFYNEKRTHKGFGVFMLKDEDIFVIKHFLDSCTFSSVEYITSAYFITNPSYDLENGYLILLLSSGNSYKRSEIEDKLNCTIVNTYRLAVDDDKNNQCFALHDIIDMYSKDLEAKTFKGKFIRFFGLDIVDIQMLDKIDLEDGKCIDIILENNTRKICIQIAVNIKPSLETPPNSYRCIIMDALPEYVEGLEANHVFTTIGIQYDYSEGKKENIIDNLNSIVYGDDVKINAKCIQTLNIEQGNIQLSEQIKASLIFPVVDKHTSLAVINDVCLRYNGHCIKIYNDKKEKNNSFEAELTLNIKTDGVGMEGYGNADIFITGFGANTQEALDDLDKGYVHILNQLLKYTKNKNESIEYLK